MCDILKSQNTLYQLFSMYCVLWLQSYPPQSFVLTAIYVFAYVITESTKIQRQYQC